MNTLPIIGYGTVMILALVYAGYTWMYKREIQRTEKQVGISIPTSLFQLLRMLSLTATGIASIACIMLFVSFLSR